MFKNVGVATALVLSLAAAPALAQQSPAMMHEKPAASTQSTGYIARQMEGEHLISSIMSETVYNKAGEEVGEVTDIVLDAEGKVVAVVIGVGGFLGVGQKDVAVSFTTLQETTKDGKKQMMVNLTKEELENAPSYTKLEDKG
jgi:sporulation protein YlmC with PRC-barrel domain